MNILAEYANLVDVQSDLRINESMDAIDHVSEYWGHTATIILSSGNRTIIFLNPEKFREYADEIWDIKPVQVDLNPPKE